MSGRVFTAWITVPRGRLFAIVHEPHPGTDNGTALLMPSAGQDNRAGPQRIYLKAARRFAAAGFCVVRLDLAGTGDSATPDPRISLDGHSTQDVAAAVRWMRESLRGRKLFLVALCAGARVAIRYAAHDKSIAGLVAWSVPTLSEGGTQYLNVKGVRKALASRRLLSSEWWRNRLKYGRKEIAQLAGSLLARLGDAVGYRRESYFIRCLARYLADRRPALFIYGSLDRILCEEFAQRFASVPEGRIDDQCFWILPEAVHTLSSLEAHAAAIDMSVAWLQHQIGQHSEHAPRRAAAVEHAGAVTA